MINKKTQPVTAKLASYIGIAFLGFISFIVGLFLFIPGTIPFGWIALPLIWIPHTCFWLSLYKILTLGFNIVADMTPEELAKEAQRLANKTKK